MGWHAECEICKFSLPDYCTFCPKCGIRLKEWPILNKKPYLRTRLKIIIHELFRWIEEEQAIKQMDSAYFMYHSELARLYPKIIPSLIQKHIRDGENTFYDYFSTLSKNDTRKDDHSIQKTNELMMPTIIGIRNAMEIGLTGFEGDLGLAFSYFENAIDEDPTCPLAYNKRAIILRQFADNILFRYGIYARRRTNTHWSEYTHLVSSEDKVLKYGSIKLGDYFSEATFELGREISWLYDKAIFDFSEAVRADPTDARNLLTYSELLMQMGRLERASEATDTVLSILNKAIRANSSDRQSLEDRAFVYYLTGQTQLSINDLEHSLSLESDKLSIHMLKRKIQALKERLKSQL
jgi:hypothetical protein